MKRYTYKKDYYGDITNLCKNITPYYVDGKPVAYYGQAIDRLSAYEDTRLTPEQIRDIDILYAEKCKELAQIKNTTKWIPCSEELPKVNNVVLVAHENGAILIAQFNKSKKFVMHDEKYGWLIIPVTAWMPLPKPYEVSDSDIIIKAE